MYLRFSMQQEDIVEHIDVKSHMYIVKVNL